MSTVIANREVVGDVRAEPSASFDVLYGRLRSLCARRMLGERVGHTLQGTALAHEVFLRMRALSPMNQPGGAISSRWFIATASIVIRQVVVDHARWRQRLKRGAGKRREGFDSDVVAEHRDPRTASDRADAILLADQLLEDLAAVSSIQAQIAQLRLFCGLSFSQIGEVVGQSESAVRREWALARVWMGSRPEAEDWCP
jgi:RNA polymerase sigma factor (TIGR02999 family)